MYNAQGQGQTNPKSQNAFNKNSAEVDITLALGEITTACNVGQANWVIVQA